MVLVVVPLTAALFSVLTRLIDDNRGPGDQSNSIKGSNIQGDILITGTQVLLQQIREQADDSVPEEIQTAVKRGVQLAREGFQEKAIIVAFTEVAARFPTAALYTNIATLQLATDEHDAAQQSLDHAAALDPDYPLVMAGQARLYASQGRTGEALAALKKLTDDPAVSGMTSWSSMLARACPASAASALGMTLKEPPQRLQTLMSILNTRFRRWAQVIPDKAGQALAAGPTPLYGCGIGILGGVEVQPGALGVLYQQALAFQTAADALADQLNQFLQFAFVRCFYALKSGRLIVAIDVDAIQEQNVEVDKVN